jgi:demethylmenaquinone methyltransferase/2-methoxy-6-polyprenyl-1,4-benzoquinol methylase
MVDLDMKDRAVREDVVNRFFVGTGRSYDRVVDITTYGLDRYWKRELLRWVPPQAGRILDLACGTGIVLERLVKRHPGAQIVGVDITAEYLAVAKDRFAGRDANISFVHSNAETMELEGRFDAVVSCYIPKYVDPDVLLSRLVGHLNPGAMVALHDFDHPRGWIPQKVWGAHMGLLKRVGRRLFPEWDVVFDENLAELIRRSQWTRRYKQAFARAGFEDVRHQRLSFRTASIVGGRWGG